MTREEFVHVAEETLDSLPGEFRSRIQNVAILVEDFPHNQSPRRPGQQRRLLLGIFHGVPATKKSFFDVSSGPAHIVLYQKNIEAAFAPQRPDHCAIGFLVNVSGGDSITNQHRPTNLWWLRTLFPPSN